MMTQTLRGLFADSAQTPSDSSQSSPSRPNRIGPNPSIFSSQVRTHVVLPFASRPLHISCQHRKCLCRLPMRSRPGQSCGGPTSIDSDNLRPNFDQFGCHRWKWLLSLAKLRPTPTASARFRPTWARMRPNLRAMSTGVGPSLPSIGLPAGHLQSPHSGTMYSSRFVCHRCASAMLIFSGSFQLYRMISVEYPPPFRNQYVVV